MKRLSKFKRSHSVKNDKAYNNDADSKPNKHRKSKPSVVRSHSLNNKKLSMKDKKKELLSLKRSLEQKKVLLSCERGDVETLKSILSKYRGTRHRRHVKSLLEFEDTTNNMKTPLVYCCISGHVDCLLELLRNSIDLERLVSGSTALYHATSRGNVECVEELLIYGANPNTLNHKGWTSLMNAAYFGHHKIAELLLKYGADPDIFRKEYDNKCALHFASKNGRYKVVELLLQYGANTDSFDTNDDMTSLMYAVKNGYYQIVQLLILYGANPYLKNDDGKCAIDLIQQTLDIDIDNTDNNIKNELFSFIQQSTHIYNAVNKLIVPETLRSIMKSLSRINFIYPPIIAQLRSVSHMHQLGESELDIYHFNDVICGQLHADLCSVEVQNDDGDEHADIEQRHDNVLGEFRNDIMLCRDNVNRCEDHIASSQKELTHMENEMIHKKQEVHAMIIQINSLQTQLKLCQQRQVQLKHKQISTKHNIANYKTSLMDLRHELEIKNQIFLVMDKASRNIRSVCNTANSVPLHHRRELHMEYRKKRKMLEENWRLWNLDDVITWICSLDPSGKFLKYKENLSKLKHLDDHSHKKRNKKRIKYNNKMHNMYRRAKDYDEGKSDMERGNQNRTKKGCSAEDVEGKNDYRNDVEDVDNIVISDADFGDDEHDDNDEVAMENHVKDKQDMNDVNILNKFDINEGQYHIETSDDSECSNNDKHGASEVIMSALMPKNDSTTTTEVDEVNDDQKLCDEFDVDQLLKNMGNIFENFSNKDSEDELMENNLLHFKELASSSSMSDGSSYSAPDQPILESINHTVLKMCGIRDGKDRKIIMYHITNLCKDKEDRKEEYQHPQRQNGAVMNEDKDHKDVDKKTEEDDMESLDDEIPSEFMCPITKQIMEDPVICSDGHSYERYAIEDWLLNHDKSPMTNAKLVTKQVFPNHSLRSMIALHRMSIQKSNQK